jgi:tetratricopeptide (TPR) repeat protein
MTLEMSVWEGAKMTRQSDTYSQALDMNMLNGDYHGMGESYFYLGISASGTQHYDSAIFYFQKSMLYAQQYRDLDLQAKVNAEIGKVYLEANQDERSPGISPKCLVDRRKN